MTEFGLIVNPVAGRGATVRVIEPLEKKLREHGIDFTMALTTRPGEGTEIARRMEAQYVVAVGGDGTVNEVANGLIGSERPMGVIPSGSGNDFVKMIGVRTKVDQAIEVLLGKKIRRIDVGTVKCSGGESQDTSPPGTSYFVNGVGLGFDAAVAARMREIRYLRGTLVYIAAVFQMLGRFSAPEFKVTTDGTSSTSRNLLIAVGNGTCAGGGFYLTPKALIDDGLFDVCLIDNINVPTILRLMPRVMRGKHLDAPEAKFFQTKEITFECDRDFFVHADGQIVGRNVRSVHVELMPKALRVIAS